jgi:hypothetical protein
VNNDEFRDYFIRMVEDWNTSTRFFDEDLHDFLERVDVASHLRKVKDRKTAFKQIADRANGLHIGMVMMKAVSPQYPCIPEVFAPLMSLFLRAAHTGKLPEDWDAIFHVIRVHATALLFVDTMLRNDGAQAASLMPFKTLPPRPNADRDQIWCDWDLEGMTPAKIRDRWNAEHPDRNVDISKSTNGTDTIKKAIRREKIRRGIFDEQDFRGQAGMSPIVPD